MERSLLWCALALGWVGWLCTLLLTYTQQMVGVVRSEAGEAAPEKGSGASSPLKPVGMASPHLLAALATPLLIFLLTLPSRPPFAPGQGWGQGFVLGSIGALLGTWSILRIQERSQALASLRSIGTASHYFLAVGITTLPLLWLPLTDVVIDPLIGIASGWFVVSLILYMGLAESSTPASSSPPDTTRSAVALTLMAGTGFLVTLCSLTALGIYRSAFSHGLRGGTWSIVAVLFATGIPFALLVGATFTGLFHRLLARTPLAQTATTLGHALLSCLFVLGLGAMLSIKVVDQPHLSIVVSLGLVSGLLLWWLAHGLNGMAHENESPSGATEDYAGAPPLSSLVLLGTTMVAYQLLQGYGVGMLLLAAWLAVGIAIPLVHLQPDPLPSTDTIDPEALPAHTSAPLTQSLTVQRLIRLLLFGVILLLYRLFLMRFRSDLHSVTLTDHYALLGFLVVAILPSLLVNTIGTSPSQGRSALAPVTIESQITRLFIAGALALVLPGAMVVLWGAKCSLALLMGLALASITGRWSIVIPQRSGLNTSLLAVAVSLVLVQWTHRVLPLAELKHAERMRVLTYGIGGFLVLLLVVDYGGRFVHWLRHRQPTKVAPASTG